MPRKRKIDPAQAQAKAQLAGGIYTGNIFQVVPEVPAQTIGQEGPKLDSVWFPLGFQEPEPGPLKGVQHRVFIAFKEPVTEPGSKELTAYAFTQLPVNFPQYQIEGIERIEEWGIWRYPIYRFSFLCAGKTQYDDFRALIKAYLKGVIVGNAFIAKVAEDAV